MMPLRSGKSLCTPTNKSYGRDASRYSILKAKKQSTRNELANLDTSTGRSTCKHQKLEALVDTVTLESLAGGVFVTPPPP
jgi:hypothetical protein